MSPKSRELVFVSGTDHEAGRLVAELHADPGGLPVMLGFHAEPGGLPDLLEARVGLEGFSCRMRDLWWAGNDQVRAAMSEESLDAALDGLAADFRSDPMASVRRFYFELISPLTSQQQPRVLVDCSYQNLRYAQIIHRLLPEARFVSAIRDGRDAALALAARGGVNDPVAGLELWLARVRQLDVGVHGEEDGEPYELPANQLEVILLERGGGQEVFRKGTATTLAKSRLLLLPGPGPDDDTASTGPGSRGAGWKGSRADRRRLDRRYSRALAALRREGAHCAEMLTVAFERSSSSKR